MFDRSNERSSFLSWLWLMNIIKVENKSNLRRSFAGDLAEFMKKDENYYTTSVARVWERGSANYTCFLHKLKLFRADLVRSRFQKDSTGRLSASPSQIIFLRARVQFDVQILEESSRIRLSGNRD